MDNEQLIKYMRVVVNHKRLVGKLLRDVVAMLTDRAIDHDLSKFGDAEFYPYAQNLSRFEQAEYGSAAYKDACKAIQPAIDHHFAWNRHHPEHFEHGITEMNLLDVIEMVCDWIAASRRVPGGQLALEIQKQRFGIDDQLYKLIWNTVECFGYLPQSETEEN